MQSRTPHQRRVHSSSILAPGAMHACKRFLPEEIYLSAGFEAGLRNVREAAQQFRDAGAAADLVGHWGIAYTDRAACFQ